MSDRYTKADVETAFRIFCQRSGFRMATSAADVDGYALSKGTGGYIVIQFMEHGGQHHPFGHRPRPAKEMTHTLNFAADAVERAKRGK